MTGRMMLVVLAGLAGQSFAQTIYEPVTVQHGGQNPYYYAGSDPAIHEAAKFPGAPGATWGRVNGYAFVSPTRKVVERRVRVFTDAFGTVNAAPYGLTPNQVVNEANARLPKYFRKSDLLAHAEVRQGVRVIAPTAPSAAPRGTIEIRPAPPHHFRGRVFVFPRSMLGKKVNDLLAPPATKA
jgi:hypothetical protein